MAAENNPDKSPYLGVSSSLIGKRWLLGDCDERLGLALAQRLQLPDVVARILSSRGVDLDTAQSFLDPKLRDLLPDPSRFKDMDKAAERITSAIMQNEQIAVFGDYDVDGATSSALFSRFINAVGGRIRTYIPDRMKEGYGPNATALQSLQDSGVSVVLTVDCGTLAFDALAAAEKSGLDVIVADHHAPGASLPACVAVINPNRLDEQPGYGHLAAVGVVFLLIIAINRLLRSMDWYSTRTEPNLMGWLDIVALGTVCDVVPLSALNRAFVTQGLKIMAARGNAGIRAVSEIAGIHETLGTYHAGFVIGPRINAGGRLGSSELGARLLSTDDMDEAMSIAQKLDGFNQERRDVEAVVLEQAIINVDQIEAGNHAMVMAIGTGWHPGVIGIVASRLKERYNRPACVIAFDEKTGLGVGSGRSVTGVDLGACILAASQAGLLVKGGGHAMAAGFTVASDKLNELRAFLNERIGHIITDQKIVPTLHVDASLALSGVTPTLIGKLDQIGPFGSGNPEPRFVIPDVSIQYAAVAGTDHVRLTLMDSAGTKRQAICFRCMGNPLGPELLNAGGKSFHIAGKIRLNNWQGRTTAQIQIEDAVPVW